MMSGVWGAVMAWLLRWCRSWCPLRKVCGGRLGGLLSDPCHARKCLANICSICGPTTEAAPIDHDRKPARVRLRNMVSIRERPIEADTRQVAGHWKGDLVFGARPSAVATLVDRGTRYAMVVALPDRNNADAVARALIEHMGALPPHLRRSLTWNRGTEMAHHSVITAALSMPVFLLRSAPPVAARHQREHEPTAAPIPSQERRPVHVHPR